MVEAIKEHGSAARDRLSMAYGRVRTSDARVECRRAFDCYSRRGKGVKYVSQSVSQSVSHGNSVGSGGWSRKLGRLPSVSHGNSFW